MNIVIISGFLGSGKTTLLLELAKRFSDQGKTLAIVENEVGAVGVDDASLREEGLTVKEIYSGCICCSLRMDLVSALLEIERDYAPDVVILEPSGVAGPKQVLAALTGYGGEIESKRLLSVVDATRFEAIQNMSIPLVTDGIEVADLVLVNKTDLVSADELPKIIRSISGVRKSAHILPISALSGEGLGAVADSLTLPSVAESTPPQEHKAGPKPTVYSLSYDFSVSGNGIKIQMSDTIERIVNRLQESGCTLIGHVKAIVKTDKGGYLVISKTDFNHPAQCKGRLPKSYDKVTVTLNAIVYGVEKQVLTSTVSDALEHEK